jgi:hypothetical protein
MRYRSCLLVSCVLLAIAIAGCQKGNDPAGPATGASADQAAETPAAAQTASTPEGAVRDFLEAVRTGNDKQTEAMFTKLAQEKLKELEDIQVAPPGSDTAKFEVGKAEMLAEDGARVASRWTDLDKEGKPRTDEIVWMVRKEPIGWRIAGMAATVFEGEDPLLLDFENPKETLRKLDMLRDEIRRRAEKSEQQAQQPGNPDAAIRR